MSRKVIILGLDGATFDIIDPLIEEGKLPNIQRIIRSGVSGHLRSTIHPITPQAWTSFATGKNAGKHGIFDFRIRQEGYTFKLVNGGDRTGKTLWQLLSEEGMRSCIVNVPFTYPVEKINGCMIPGFDAPSVDKERSYPEGIVEEIASSVGSYEFKGTFPSGMKVADYRPELVEKVISNRAEVARFLLSSKDCDLFMLVFNEIDHMQHLFWSQMEEKKAGRKEKYTEKFGSMIEDAYILTDQAIGRILDSVPDDRTIILMSDHGAGPIKKNVYLNRLLAQHDLLFYKASRGDAPSFKVSSLRLIRRVVKRSIPDAVLGLLKNRFASFMDKAESTAQFGDIDWGRTLAFSYGMFGNISVNLKGREPNGTVGSSDMESLLKRIEDILYNLTDPETGEKVVENIFRGASLFEGPHASKAPDLLIEWKDYAYFAKASGERDKVDVFDSEMAVDDSDFLYSGTHRLNGMFAAMGPDIIQGSKLSGAGIEDVAPTVLYLMDMPIPNDLDGKVLSDVFSKEFTDQNIVKLGAGSDTASRPESIYNETEEDEIRSRLSGLGYLE